MQMIYVSATVVETKDLRFYVYNLGVTTPSGGRVW